MLAKLGLNWSILADQCYKTEDRSNQMIELGKRRKNRLQDRNKQLADLTRGTYFGWKDEEARIDS